jgi:5,10-methylenetetrahydromethanopterin reductase
MRFSLRLNNDLAPADYVRLARAAEAHGFHQIWISNDLFLRSGPVLVAAVVQATERIEVGTGILNPHTIHPAELAMLAATMDELSGCRFNLGLGAGAGDFLRWVGLADPRPLRTMRETMRTVRALLAGDGGVTGPGWAPAEAYLRFPAPRVTPIYLGAMGPGMLRLAGEVADGVLPLLFPPEHYFTVRPLVEEGRARRGAGTPADAFDFAACLWVSISTDAAAARQALGDKVAYYGHALSPLILERLGVGRDELAPVERAIMTDRDPAAARRLLPERMLRIGVHGPPEALVERLAPLVEAGAEHLSFGPPLGPDPLEAVELLGARVLPLLRQGAPGRDEGQPKR